MKGNWVCVKFKNEETGPIYFLKDRQNGPGIDYQGTGLFPLGRVLISMHVNF